MSLDALREEFEAVRVGPLILREVQNLAAAIVLNYDPVTYGGGQSWSHSLDDLVQECIAEILLGANQIEYLMDVARELADFRNLLARQIRRLLANRRRRSVVDNLLERCAEILTSPPFLPQGGDPPTSWSIPGADNQQTDFADSAVRAAALLVSQRQTIVTSARDRAPRIFSTPDLRELTVDVAKTLGSPVTRKVLRQVFELGLTAWLVGPLSSIEGAERVPSGGLSPEDAVLVEEAKVRILNVCSNDDRALLLGKLRGETDAALAARLGVSRVTIHSRKTALHGLLAAELASLDEALHDAVIEALAIQGGSE